MSRIGLKPIEVPSGTKIKIEGNTVTVEGSKGKLTRTFSPEIAIKLEGTKLLLSREGDAREQRSAHGLTRTILANMVDGVSKGFQKSVEINGVGFKALKNEKGLSLQIGFCHLVDFVMPAGTEAVIEGTNKIHVKGIDKELVGLTAARIRDLRRADAYKGKGIIYSGEKLRLKPGKAGKTALRK
ncbi:MAG: 50S ribosomal protein L6 [Chloroflexi bacterium RBG_16_48_7]|nr:MAG: 50S ribosomal protein L6 [Chloroflexi bacterium RBG_16_48_7]